MRSENSFCLDFFSSCLRSAQMAGAQMSSIMMRQYERFRAEFARVRPHSGMGVNVLHQFFVGVETCNAISLWKMYKTYKKCRLYFSYVSRSNCIEKLALCAAQNVCPNLVWKQTFWGTNRTHSLAVFHDASCNAAPDFLQRGMFHRIRYTRTSVPTCGATIQNINRIRNTINGKINQPS